MQYYNFFVLLFSCVFNTNARSVDNSHSVIPNDVLKLFSANNASNDEIHLGQITGLATSIKNPNQLFIFHRASREWNSESFPDGHHFDKNKFNAIIENPIVTVNVQTGETVNEWGNNTFYMPHGLFIDNQENIWLTDVAMHQVFKYSEGKQILRLGELFVPGEDSSHFCKPTDVVVSKDGLNIYVADGYCNSRIVKFDSKGKFIKQYQMPKGEKQLMVPHSLALIESLSLLCVADRENGRIVCFDTENDEGKVKHIIEHSSMKTVYAIAYHSDKNRLYAVSGRKGFNEPLGYTFSVDSHSFGHLIDTWEPTDKFGEPHDLALSVDGRSLFVGQIRPSHIYLFDLLD